MSALDATTQLDFSDSAALDRSLAVDVRPTALLSAAASLPSDQSLRDEFYADPVRFLTEHDLLALAEDLEPENLRPEEDFALTAHEQEVLDEFAERVRSLPKEAGIYRLEEVFAEEGHGCPALVVVVVAVAVAVVTKVVVRDVLPG